MASKRLSKRREQGQAGPDELAMTQSVHPTALFGGSPGGSPQRHYLLVFDGQSCYSCDLPASGAVVIGRAPECDLLIEAPSASRQHARIDVSSDAVWVCDLESRNGTRLNGELIAGTRQLFSGDVISICTATLLFHRSTETALQRSPLPLSYLRQRLREEISRARHYQRPAG